MWFFAAIEKSFVNPGSRSHHHHLMSSILIAGIANALKVAVTS